MATLTARQIAEPAHNAGFTGTQLVVAVAIALAESGGNTLATHTNTNGSKDYGLWQINSVHADLLRSYTWSNPQDNAIMAHRVFADAGNKFTPWSTYKSGRYLAFMSVARGAVSASGSPLPSTAAGSKPSNVGGGGTGAQPSGLPLPNPVGALQGITDFVNLMLNPHTWLRLAMFGAGIALVFMGLRAAGTWDNKIGSLGKQAALAVATDGASAAAKAAV